MLIPSPPPDANGTTLVRGLVNSVAQVFAGVKTFLNTIIASAGVQTASLFNTNGLLSTDNVVRVGTTQTYAAVNASARLWSAWYGLGGAETEHLTLTRNGLYFNGYPNSAISCSGSWLQLGVLPVRADSYFYSTASSTAFYASSSGGFSANGGLRLWSETLGAGASDVVAKAGAYIADGSVNSAAKLFSIRTGLGGTEVESVYFKKGSIIGTGTGAGADCLKLGTTSVELMTTYFAKLSAPFIFYAAGSSGLTETVRLIGQRGDAGLKCATIGTENATPSDDCVLTQFSKGITTAATDAGNGTALARVMASGRIDQAGTDTTGSPGAATVNKPKGKAAIAVGAASVVITNSLVTAASHVIITPHARDATCKELIATPAAGSFTVSGTANATAALAFSWEVSTLI